MSVLKKSHVAFAASAVALGMMLGAPSAAQADNDRGRNGRYERHDDGKRDQRGHASYKRDKKVVYVPQYYRPQPQRRVVYSYYPQYHYAPTYYYGHAGHHPFVGRRLVTYAPVPPHMVTYLRPVPRGYYYSRYDSGNVFLVRQSDNVIEQVISLLLGN